MHSTGTDIYNQFTNTSFPGLAEKHLNETQFYRRALNYKKYTMQFTIIHYLEQC